MKSLTESELMQRLAADDMAALGELFLRHHDRVFALAYRILGDWASAEDVTQETFLRVQQGAHRYTRTAQFTTWICRIVINLCMDEKRRHKRRALAWGGVGRSEDTTSQDPAALQERKEQRARVWQGIMRLNERQRQAVILHRLQGLSHQEISEQTGWTPSAVESLLVRAYRNLQNDLSGLA